MVDWLDTRVEMSAATFGTLCISLGFLIGLVAGLATKL
jgi:hypothetical protein